MVVHERIDGYSHLIVVLKCNDNRSSTVLDSFQSAVQQPKKIKIDQGENVQVCMCLMNV